MALRGVGSLLARFLVFISSVRKEVEFACLAAMVRRTTRLQIFLLLCPSTSVCYLHLSGKAEAYLGLIFLIDPPEICFCPGRDSAPSQLLQASPARFSRSTKRTGPSPILTPHCPHQVTQEPYLSRQNSQR